MGLGWKRFGLGGVAAATFIVIVVVSRTSATCADIDRLVAEAATDFEAIRGTLIDSTHDEWSTTYAIDDLSSCSIVLDPAQALYSCAWEHDLTSGTAATAYEAEVERVRSCLGGVTEHSDASVNHPDFWASTRFIIPDGEVIVSVKNKGALGKAFVTIGASSPTNSG